MKLFLRNHLSWIIFYIVTAICLPILIHQLDSFENHFVYFVFLMLFLLVSFLVARYIRRRHMYRSIEEREDELPLAESLSTLEKAYDKKMHAVQRMLLEQEQRYEDFSDEQQLLISHAVHQMKTPLSVMQLLIQTNEKNYPHLIQEWQKLSKETYKLNLSLNQLLTYSRSHELLADVKFERTVLKEIVQEVVNDLKVYFIENQMFPKIEAEKDTILYTDRKWLKVVIYQLLNNAIKYGKNETTVVISFNERQLSVENQGETIDVSEIKRVFDLFYTGRKGRETGEATGIGLYLVKKILETLDYAYDLESGQNKTIFTISFSK